MSAADGAGPGLHHGRPWAKATSPTFAEYELARWLLATEQDAADWALTCPAAAERVMHKLGLRLAQLITQRGYDALLARAAHLARVPSPLADHAGQLDEQDDVVLVATLVALLGSFIGGHLTLRVLRDVWPTLPLSEPDELSAVGAPARVRVGVPP